MEHVPAQLLEMLVCPKCRTKVAEAPKGLVCTNKDCRLVYPVRNGIPIMLTGEAVRTDDANT